MTTRPWAFGLLAVALLLGGCAGTTDEAEAPPASPAASSSPSSGAPPEKAAMVCDTEISGQLQQILDLDSVPQRRTTWADQVFTCDYDLPMGALVLSVNVSPSAAEANAFFDGARARRPAATDLVGLGERAAGDPAGAVIVVKDDMTLTVDATKLPPVIGDNGQKRFDLAFTVANAVLGCWT